MTFAAFNKHNASRFGAALAFYIVFSAAPIVLIVIGVSGTLFGRQHAEQEILDRIGGSFGSAAGIAIAAMIKASRLIGGEVLWHAAQLLVPTFVLTVLFAAVFRYLPEARVT